MSKEELAIREMIDRFIEAYNSADVDALMSTYTEDLVKLRHKSEPEGKAETAVRIRKFFEAFTGHLSAHNDELIILGDAAFARGELEIIATPRSTDIYLSIEANPTHNLPSTFRPSCYPSFHPNVTSDDPSPR